MTVRPQHIACPETRRGSVGRFALVALTLAVCAWSAAGALDTRGVSAPVVRHAPDTPPFPALDIALLRQVVGEHARENIVLSPFSLGMAALPLLVGTTGEVQREWAALLGGADGASPPDIATAGARFAATLTRDTLLTFRSANALWAPPTVPFRAALADSLQREFGATIRTVDLTTEAGIGAVNAWTDSVTRGKIPVLFEEPLQSKHPDDTFFVLENAVYFFGRWMTPFDSRETRPRPFYALGEQAVRHVPTMHAVLWAHTFHDDTAEGVWLPYRSEAMGLLVVMPTGRQALPAFVAQLPNDALGRWLGRLKPEEIELELPRANITTKQSLFDPLKRLGLRASATLSHDPWVPLFGEGPFTTPEPKLAQVIEILQRTTFELAERGVEATAATAIVGKATEGLVTARPKPRRVQIDRPFLIAVVGREAAAPLFVGQIVNP